MCSFLFTSKNIKKIIYFDGQITSTFVRSFVRRHVKALAMTLDLRKDVVGRVKFVS
jgi:hypothetical protein